MLYELSNAAACLKGQPMFKLLARIQDMERQGHRIVHFEIGDPDFPTPPHVVDEACRALRSGYTHYTNAMGVLEFRQAIARHVDRTRGFLPDIGQVVVTPSANTIIYFAVQCLVNPGDEVIVPDPAFPSYEAVFSLCGVKGVPVRLKEENGFRLSPSDVEKALTGRTRMVIVNSPHNPTGAVMLPEELERIARICMEHGIYLYSDEVYARMIYGETPFYSPTVVDQCKSNVILATGFSKEYAMTGWRLGYCIAPERICEKMGLLIQTTTSCVSGFIQCGGQEALEGSQEDVDRMMRIYKERRDQLVEGLNRIHGIDCLTPAGAFYVYPNITGTGLTSRVFTDRALEEAHVGLLPGTDFGPSGEGYVRLCYAASQEDIAEGVARLHHVFGGKTRHG